jgi:hypothetical protein
MSIIQELKKMNLSNTEIALLENTYGDDLEQGLIDLKNDEITLHAGSTAVEIASDFIDDYQIIANSNCFLQNYFDYEKFANDLGFCCKVLNKGKLQV